MLVWLAEYLTQYFSFFNVFSYLTFRAILGILTSLLLSLYLGPKLIARLQQMQIGQVVRNDGPQSHFSKKGTPTMGGLLILGAVLLSTLMWANLDNKYVWVVLFVLISFGWIGFVDDYRKVIRKDPKGLIARWKYFWQSLFAILTAAFIYFTAERPAETALLVPFLKDVMPQLGLLFLALWLLPGRRRLTPSGWSSSRRESGPCSWRNATSATARSRGNRRAACNQNQG